MNPAGDTANGRRRRPSRIFGAMLTGGSRQALTQAMTSGFELRLWRAPGTRCRAHARSRRAARGRVPAGPLALLPVANGLDGNAELGRELHLRQAGAAA